MKIAVYPGSFDPVTLGHIDVVERSSKIFDKVIVTVMYNSGKQPMFSQIERVELLKQSISHLSNVEVDSYDGLLTDYMRNRDLTILVKGLRVISDFESEFQMASVNQKLLKELETVFVMTRTDYMYLSSSIVKEVARLNGDISGFVTKPVKKAIEEKLGVIK